MKILYLTCWYPTDEQPGNGIFVREHARAAAKAGADVRVLQIWPVYDPGTLWRTDIRNHEEGGIPTSSVLIRSRFHKAIYGNTPLMNLLARRFYVEQVYTRFEPDLVHAHVIYQAGVMAWGLHRMHGLPYVISEHWSKLDWYFNRPWFSYPAATVYKEAEAVMPVSDYLGVNIRGFVPDLQPEQMPVVPNVVDTDLFYYKEQDEREGEGIELLAVMNFTHEHKRPLVLLEAIAQLPDELQRHITLRLIGKGEGVVDDTEALVKRYELEAEVIYDGFREKSYIADAMRRADFLVHPSERETFGVVVAEALCCGLPCIVSDRWALPEHIGEDEDYLVPDNSAKAWRDVLQKNLAGEKNVDRTALSETHRQRYAPGEVGQTLCRIYDQALNNS
ncbi:MAG: glycosyltransferase [Balneolaceae bacterium]|nr:glycosyltransferase [Balneolaceae bacterium]